MSDPTPTGFVPTRVPARLAGIEFSFLKPTDWQLADLPAEDIDFDKPTAFAPLCVAVASYGALVFAVAARPAYEDGAVAQWLAWAAGEEGCDPGEVEQEQLGPHAAVACWGMQRAGETVLRARLAMVEDGGRLIQVSVMAPQAMWLGANDMLRTMLRSFTLTTPLGARAPLTAPGTTLPPSSFLAGPRVAPAPTPEPAPTPVVDPTPEPAATDAGPSAPEAPSSPHAAFALADDAATLDPDHPQNVRMRERGIGFAPRVHATDTDARWVEVASGAILASLRLPFGWFALDDGRRLLVYHPDGAVQINFDRRQHRGQSHDALLAELQDDLARQSPAARFLRVRLGEMECLGVRDLVVDGEALEQAYLLREATDTNVLAVRVTAAPDGITRALDLTELLLRDVKLFDAVASDAR